jgi:serine/threonine protein kinase
MNESRKNHFHDYGDTHSAEKNPRGPQPPRPLELRQSFFDVPLLGNRYTLVSVIGEGAYGVVCSAVDNQTREKVAVKRIRRVFDEVPEAVRILRELRFLRLLRSHENIITIREVLAPSQRDSFNDVFVVFELMPADLNRVLRAKIALSQDHIRWLMYQLLQALHYMHSCNVLHRDIKPNNIMINERCDLRVIDFGLARLAYNQQEDMACWTDYVATRWYRAPELIMSYSSRYSAAIDIWSAGCIFAELLNHGEPLFPGVNSFHQLELIVKLLGTPNEESIAKVRNPKAKQHLRSLPKRPPQPLAEVFPDTPPDALDLLQNLLQFDPDKRLTALEGLQHVYFRGLYAPESIVTGNPLSSEEFFFEREQVTADQLRLLFWEEILHYHPDLRQQFLHEDSIGYEIPSQADRFRKALADEQRDGMKNDRNYYSMPKEKLAAWTQLKEYPRNLRDAAVMAGPKQVPPSKIAAKVVTPTGTELQKDAATSTVDRSLARTSSAGATETDLFSGMVAPQLLRNASTPDMIDVDDDDDEEEEVSDRRVALVGGNRNESDDDGGSAVMMEARASFAESFREF